MMIAESLIKKYQILIKWDEITFLDIVHQSSCRLRTVDLFYRKKCEPRRWKLLLYWWWMFSLPTTLNWQPQPHHRLQQTSFLGTSKFFYEINIKVLLLPDFVHHIPNICFKLVVLYSTLTTSSLNRNFPGQTKQG